MAPFSGSYDRKRHGRLKRAVRARFSQRPLEICLGLCGPADTESMSHGEGLIKDSMQTEMIQIKPLCLDPVESPDEAGGLKRSVLQWEESK
jgi:hypothetical protein